MPWKKHLPVFLVLLAGTVFLAGCLTEKPLPFKELQKFSSYEELVAEFKKSSSQRHSIWDAMKSIGMPMTATSEAGTGGADYSRTNIQVEGVDEADIVKTDGKYIYNFSKNRLIITSAYPIETAQILSQTDLNDIYPSEMFVSGNKLLLFGSKQQYYPFEPLKASSSIMPRSYYGSIAAVQLYNVSDRANPTLEKEIVFQGNYLTSRMIGNYAYFVINSFPDYAFLEKPGDGSIIPLMTENGVEKRIAKATEIGFLPPMPAESFVTIASMNINSGETQKETIAGSAQSVFASQKYIYLASTVWNWPENVVKDTIDAIVPGNEKTVINKFGLDNGKTGFVGQGSVSGHVLNQFSMDEFEGNFRIATTIGEVWRGGESQSKNNLYVLSPEMNTIGKLEDLAPGEKIYSARFMGKKAYLVTFKKVDPLFVIDVSDPASPKVLGKLKIPGYSDYLHPIDESHLIGIGKETIEAKGGNFAWYQGMKMAVFDVSDVSNPIEMHKIVIGDRGTDSYALHDHKAFLYDKEKQLLVLPIMLAEIPAEQKKPLNGELQFPAYGEPVFQGAFVFRLTLENGFEERGRITHVSAEDEIKRGYYFGDEYSVQRALYIGSVLYTLSDRMIKANSLDSLQELKELVFAQ